ncbi:hypothetical protein GGR53DRAFT_473455 [Hypoxylon sp. FL1150]|nr:hypothetical protein GGR53DRAFT_473455 [Hypoxylon sp. FL1150]
MKGVYGPLPTEETVFFDDQGQPATEEENEASVAAAAMAAADETTFPRFPELPTELRFLIWELALPRRVFEIRQETATVNSNGEASIDEHAINRSLDHPEPIAALLAPPVLLQVCREARKVAMRTGSWKYVGSLSYEKNSIDRLRTWFDPSTDTLCFDNSWAIQSVQGPFREQNGIVMEPGNNPAITRVYFGNSPASPICLSLHALTDVSGKFYAEQWKRRRGFWSGVPRYMFYHDSIRLCLGRSSRVQEIFGKDADRCHTLLVDAHDYAKLQQLRELFLGECNAADTYSDVSNRLLSFSLYCTYRNLVSKPVSNILKSNQTNRKNNSC